MKIWTIAVVVTITGVLFPQSSLCSTNTANPETKQNEQSVALSEADRLMAFERYDEAESIYQKLLSTDRTGRACSGIAIILAKKDSLPSAKAYLREASINFPHNSSVQAAAGFLAFLQTISEQSPARRDMYMSAAQRLSEQAIELDSNCMRAYYTLGLVSQLQNNLLSSEEHFRKSLRLTECPENLASLADVLLILDPSDQEGATLVERALLLDQKCTLAHVLKSQICLNRLEIASAIRELEKVSESARDARWHVAFGDVLYRRSDQRAAITEWNKAKALDEFNSYPYERIADHYVAQGNQPAAESEIRQGLQVNPFNQALRSRLAELVRHDPRPNPNS